MKHYKDAGRVVRVLEGVDLEVATGEKIAITGESGVGKSTLLHVLGALDRPTSGTVRHG
ncbi:MAG: ATP-binding cassette domain-containing protein, partial [bacterium]